ncbi:hypothetical protein DSO57_1031389 [Entomophthora muscae]|uniref:Uncharacterized protein n=1 Tax=Entomophthora muscae TaxID=34485 RepID=A0ACC2UAA2_9FUNG|nr:hypothetical protein DSO57_1031389 [Entomophthora muscae]
MATVNIIIVEMGAVTMSNSGKTKNCHFCSPEQIQPGPAALKTLSQDPCPAGKPPMDTKSAKSKKEKSHVHTNPTLSSLSDLPSQLQPSRQPGNQATAPSRD